MARQNKTQLVIEGRNTASKAFKQADKQLLGISSAAKKAGAAIAGAFSVGVIASWIKSSIDAADESRKLAQAVGMTTESWTGYQWAASQSGVSTTELTASITRLNRSMADAATIGGKPAQAFAKMDVSVRDMDGSLRSADDVLLDIADRFKDMPDGVEKSALAVELLGRSGAKLIPLLNGGSEGIKALVEQAERLGLVVSDEQAANSERFNDTLAAMGGASRGAANTISGELLPTMNELGGLMLDLVEDGDSAKTMADVLSFAMKGLATVVLAVGNTFGNLGRLIGATAAAAVSAARGDFSMAGQIFRDVTADNEKAARETEARIKKLWSGEFAEAGEAAAKVMGDVREIEAKARAETERFNRAFADSYRNMTYAAKSALQDLVREEKATQKEIEDLRKKRLEIEQHYAQAIAGFSGGGGGPSYSKAEDLKVAAMQALAKGDHETAAKMARESLKVLSDLAAAGENTYGFEGFANQLKAIELEANKIEQTKAEEKLKSIADQVEVLNAKIADLTEFDIKLELTDAEKQKIIDQMEELRKLLGQPVSIQAQLSAGGDSLPGYASGGQIRGPGSGTSDSILARLSNGEYVIRAAAVRKYGTTLLDNINGMRLPKFAGGGLVGGMTPASSGAPVNLHLDGHSYEMRATQDVVDALHHAVRVKKLRKR